MQTFSQHGRGEYRFEYDNRNRSLSSIKAAIERIADAVEAAGDAEGRMTVEMAEPFTHELRTLANMAGNHARESGDMQQLVIATTAFGRTQGILDMLDVLKCRAKLSA